MPQSKKETKRERFVRLAEKRTNEVLDRLRILGGCANRRMYDYDVADVRKIKKAISDELNRVMSLFSDDEKKEFKLGAK